jgi:hypothetical protein
MYNVVTAYSVIPFAIDLQKTDSRFPWEVLQKQ